MRPKISPLAASLMAVLATPSLAQVPNVVTDIPAIGSLTAQVMGDLGTPEVLLAPGVDEHNYQLRPSQARALQEADLLIWVGPELTPWLSSAAQSQARVLGLLASEGTLRQPFIGHAQDDIEALHEDHMKAAAQAHDHDHEGHGHEEDAHDEHAHDGTDPHAWLDPDNAMIWLANISANLAQLDPDNAATYRANAETAAAKIRVMTAELEAEIAPYKDRPFVVTHDAYGYLQAHFALKISGSILLGDASAAGASHPRDLLDQMQKDGAICIFPESQIDQKPAEILAQGTTVRVGQPIDPSGSSHETGPDLYETMMRDLIGTIRACLQG